MIYEADVVDSVKYACIQRVLESGYGRNKDLREIAKGMEELDVKLDSLFTGN
ncbi:MAG: hypothetical protein IIA45_04365 [Bacteroidetes bacterium]|nr:hypothetical protein [Bacteroidota bacterium]